jgi:hypothetical protein
MKELIIKVDEEKMDIEGNAPVIDKPQELVRCKDCKFFGSDGHYCKIRGIGRPLEGDDFCFDGRSVN